MDVYIRDIKRCIEFAKPFGNTGINMVRRSGFNHRTSNIHIIYEYIEEYLMINKMIKHATNTLEEYFEHMYRSNYQDDYTKISERDMRYNTR